MGNKADKKSKEMQKWVERQYVKHRRHNAHFAKPGKHQCVIILDNLKPSFNIGKIFRSGDAFGIAGIHLVGTDFFPPQSAKGSFKWVPAFFHSTFDDCYRILHDEGYVLFILEPDTGNNLLHQSLPQKSGFIFGHEEHGISFNPDDYPEVQRIVIPQFGRVESLNVSIAASVVMYEYLRQHTDSSN